MIPWPEGFGPASPLARPLLLAVLALGLAGLVPAARFLMKRSDAPIAAWRLFRGATLALAAAACAALLDGRSAPAEGPALLGATLLALTPLHLLHVPAWKARRALIAAWVLWPILLVLIGFMLFP